jgi:hypothetical protein
MAAGIQGRVSEHGDPGELDPVQYGLGRIPSATASSGNALLVDMEFESVQSRIFHWRNGIIGTNHGAHGASDTGVFHPGFLADAIKRIILVGMGGVLLNGCFNDPFLKHLQFNGLDRADGGTLTTQGAPVIAVPDLPGQIIQA